MQIEIAEPLTVQFKLNMSLALHRRLWKLAKKRGDVSEIALTGIEKEVQLREQEENEQEQKAS